jgi:hypothetical protein
MRDLPAQLVTHLDAIFASFVFIFACSAYAWWRTQSSSLEGALFVLSMVVMPLVYLAMFLVAPVRFLSVAGLLALFAPQFYVLLFLACCSFRSLLKRDPIIFFAAILAAFAVNLGGYVWTRSILFSHSS